MNALETREAIVAHLRDNPGDRFARLQLADLEEEDGNERMAAAQRRLARLECDLHLDPLEAFRIREALIRKYDPDFVPDFVFERYTETHGFDEELAVWWFQPRFPETDVDSAYPKVVACRDGIHPLAELTALP